MENEPFPETQITSLVKLLDTLKRHYAIPANFIGHADVAPGRKNDPSHLLSLAGFVATGVLIVVWILTAVVVPDYFNATQALRIIGYNVKDTLAAIRSFNDPFCTAGYYYDKDIGQMMIKDPARSLAPVSIVYCSSSQK